LDLKKYIVQNYISLIFSKGISLLNVIYLAKALEKVEFGNYQNILIFSSIIAFSHLGIESSFPILFSKKNINKSIANSYLVNNLITSFLLKVLFLPVIFILNFGLNSAILFLIIPNLILTPFFNYTRTYFDTNLIFQKSINIRYLMEILIPLFSLIGLIFFKDLKGFFLGQSFSSILIFLVCIFNLKDTDFKIVSSFKNDLKESFKWGYLIIITAFLDLALKQIDRWFISKYYSISDLADYGFASNFAFIILAISSSYLSQYNALVKDFFSKQKLNEGFSLINKLQKNLFFLILIIIVFSVSLYTPFLKIVIGKYLNTTQLFSVLAASTLFFCLSDQYIGALNYHKRTLKLIANQSLTLSISLLLNFSVVILKLETIYFAYTTLFVIFIYFLLTTYEYKKLSKKKNFLVSSN
jgi:O-antigen/teichoic acid export membrane protein